MEIKVVGIGGDGCSAITSLFNDMAESVDFINIDTDKLDITQAKTHKRLLLNDLNCMNTHLEDITGLLFGADVVILVTCLGGSTGSSISPLIAELAQQIGIPIFAFVTQPFTSEKAENLNAANIGLEELKKYINAFMLIPNDKLNQVLPSQMPLAEKFRALHKTLCEVVFCVLCIFNQRITSSLKIKLLTSSLSSRAIIGVGCAEGKKRVEDALEIALSAPLFYGVSIDDIQELVVVISTYEGISNGVNTLLQNNIKKYLSPKTKITIIFAAHNNTEGNLKLTLFATSRKI
jgi:cell division protein FtsZ